MTVNYHRIEQRMKEYIYELEKTLQSSKDAVKYAESIIKEVRSKTNLANELYYNLVVAVTEAVNNAIIHGNRSNPIKNVIFKVQVSDSNIAITIHDEGNGFDVDKIADPREPENLLKSNGRGVFLIKSLMDEVVFSFNESGTKLFMSVNY